MIWLWFINEIVSVLRQTFCNINRIAENCQILFCLVYYFITWLFLCWVSLFGCCFTIYVMVIVMHASAFGGCSFCCQDNSSGAGPFCYCRPHYMYFYGLGPPIISRYLYILHCFSSASTHWAYSLLPHVCLAIFSIDILIQ